MGCPHERLAKALYVLSFLNHDEMGQTACERQYSFDTKAHRKPPVMVKDLLIGEWKGPKDLVTQGGAMPVSPQAIMWRGSARVCAAFCCMSRTDVNIVTVL